MAQKPQNSGLFIVGIVCLVLSLGFLLFSLYIIPYLLFNIGYNLPGFIMDYIQYFQDKYEYSSANSKLIVWLSFAIPGLITGYVSYYISHSLDKEREHDV